MVFTSNPLSAEDAYPFGLLNRLVSPEKLESTTMEIAQTIAADEYEFIQGERRAAFFSDDLKEGVKAFFEKRAPVFQGK